MSEQHFAEIQRELASLRLEDTLLHLNKLLATSRGRLVDPTLHEIVNSRESGVPAFVVHFLAKHLLLNASNLGPRHPDGQTYLRLHDAYFKLPDPILSDPNWKDSDPTGFLIRIIHSQLRSQRRNPLQMYGIAASLFGNIGSPSLIGGKTFHEHLDSILGMPVETFMRLGFLCQSIQRAGCQGVFTHMDLSEAFCQGINCCVPEVWEMFLQKASTDRDGFRRECEESLKLAPAPVQHEVNPLEQYPIIDIGSGHFIAVDPDLVVNRTTSLLYFDLLECFGESFQQAFGECFEHLVGTLILSFPGHSNVWSDHDCRSQTRNDVLSRLGRRADWAVTETSLNVLFECKALQMPLRLATVGSQTDVQKIRDRITDAARQLNEHSVNIQRGAWTEFGIPANPSLGVIVTFGRVETANTPFFRKPIEDQLRNEGIDTIPFVVLSIDELDSLMALVESGQPLGNLVASMATSDSSSFEVVYEARKRLQSGAMSKLTRARGESVLNFLPD